VPLAASGEGRQVPITDPSTQSDGPEQ
jgi:hypothetical protein